MSSSSNDRPIHTKQKQSRSVYGDVLGLPLASLLQVAVFPWIFEDVAKVPSSEDNNVRMDTTK